MKSKAAVLFSFVLWHYLSITEITEITGIFMNWAMKCYIGNLGIHPKGIQVVLN